MSETPPALSSKPEKDDDAKKPSKTEPMPPSRNVDVPLALAIGLIFPLPFLIAKRLSGTAYLVLAAVLTVGVFGISMCVERGSLNFTKPPSSPAGSVSVLEDWPEAYHSAFAQIVLSFQETTGIQVADQHVSDAASALSLDLKSGQVPDVVELQARQVHQFANSLVDIGQIVQQIGVAPMWQSLGQVDGVSLAALVRADAKGLVWYNRGAFNAKAYSPPATWDQLITLQSRMKADGITPWCIGLKNGAATGSPGSDWITSFVLTRQGPAFYDSWANGKQSWSSNEMKETWLTWNQVLGQDYSNVYGGKGLMASARFTDVAAPMFAKTPQCYMQNQPSSITSFFPEFNPTSNLSSGFGVFALPAYDKSYAGSNIVTGDFVSMARDTQASRKFLAYLLSDNAQSVWVHKTNSVSGSARITPSSYPLATQHVAELMHGTKSLRLDAPDLMPDPVRSAYWQGVVAFVASPANLDKILASIDTAQTLVGASNS